MSASFSITIEGKGTFTASIADPEASVTVGTNTPASFTAEVAPVGPAGVVAATAPIVYTSGTQTVSMDTAYFVRSPATAATDGQIVSWDDATARPVWIDNYARSLFSTVRNETGATLVAGTVVYISGAAGNKALVTKAQANTEAASSLTFAVIATAIPNNQNGTAIVAGELGKLDTTAFAEGATLYLSPTTAGTFTTTKPTAPNHIVYIGTVTRVHANQGTIEVRIQNGSELDEMADVLFTTKANNDLLVYESSSSLWKNKSIATLDLATQSWVTSQGYLTAPYNPFDQTLNTSSTVQFAGVSISGLTGYVVGMSSASVYAINTTSGQKGAFLNGDGLNLLGSGSGIIFADSTTQTTAAVSPPSASTTVEGIVELATTAEAIAGTDTARAITPQTANAVSYLESYDQQDITALSFNAGVSVHTALQAANYKNLNHNASTAIGFSYLACLNFLQVGNTNQTVGIDWSKKVILSFNLSRSVASPSAGSVFRACLGKTQAGGTVGDLINTGIGIKIAGSGVVQLMAYNAGALVTNNTSYTPNGTEAFAVKLVSYGNGTVECFINGNSVGTNTNAPTAVAAAFLYNTTFECQQVASVATTTQWTVNCIKQSFGKR